MTALELHSRLVAIAYHARRIKPLIAFSKTIRDMANNGLAFWRDDNKKLGMVMRTLLKGRFSVMKAAERLPFDLSMAIYNLVMYLHKAVYDCYCTSFAATCCPCLRAEEPLPVLTPSAEERPRRPLDRHANLRHYG